MPSDWPIHLPHPATTPADVLLDACEIQRTRASGPGGQHRNKVETAIRITHRPTQVIGQASERRSQEANKKVAIFRLRVNLALAVRVNWNQPSPLWQSRLQSQSIRVNEQHDDYPAMLAQALDAIAAHDSDVKTAAQALGCTLSQLVRFLKTQPRALALVNQARAGRSLHPLR